MSKHSLALKTSAVSVEKGIDNLINRMSELSFTYSDLGSDQSHLVFIAQEPTPEQIGAITAVVDEFDCELFPQIIDCADHGFTAITCEVEVETSQSFEKVVGVLAQMDFAKIRQVAKDANRVFAEYRGGFPLLLPFLCDLLQRSTLINHVKPLLYYSNPSRVVIPRNTYYPYQFHLNYCQLPAAWEQLKNFNSDYKFGSPNVRIAVIDTGVESVTDSTLPVSVDNPEQQIALHPQLDGLLTDGSKRISMFYDFDKKTYYTKVVAEKERKKDQEKGSHGMATTSLIGASSNMSSKVAGIDEGISGVASNCHIISAKRTGANPEFATGQIKWLAGVNPNIASITDPPPAHPADVINASYKLTDDFQVARDMADAITSFGRGGRGTMLFIAAGNASQPVDNGPVDSETELSLLYPKLIGVTSSSIVVDETSNTIYERKMSDNSKNYKKFFALGGGNIASSTFKGVDFCVPEVAENIFTLNNQEQGLIFMPVAASYFDSGTTFGFPNNPFFLRVDPAGPDVMATNDTVVVIASEPLAYVPNGTVIEIGSKDDVASSLRSSLEPHIATVVNVTAASKTIQFTPALTADFDKTKLTIKVYNHLWNPPICTRLAATLDVGTDPLKITVDHAHNFTMGQVITVGLPGRPIQDLDNTESRSIVNIMGNVITVDTPFTINRPQGDFVTLQRTLLGTVGTSKLQLDNAFGFDKDVNNIIVVGDPFKLGSKEPLTFNSATGEADDKRLTSNAVASNQISVNSVSGLAGLIGEPVTAHRSVSSQIQKGDPDFDITSAAGLVEGQRLYIGFLADVDFEVMVITGIDYANNKITVDRTFEFTHSTHTIVMAGEMHYFPNFIGTSFSAPVATGIAALILSAEPTLSWLEVREIMRNTCDKINVAPVSNDDTNRNDGVGAWYKERPGENKAQLVSEALYSRWYGFGRLNADLAIQNALNYLNSGHPREFLIRDIMTDDGTPGTSSTVIDSPDIWVRTVDPDDDTNNIPANWSDSAAPFHQDPDVGKDKWIYVRIANKGTALPTLEDADVVVSLTFTTSADSPMQFHFPEKWDGSSYAAPFEETVFLTPFLTTDNPRRYFKLSDNKNPHHIPPIPPSTSAELQHYIAVIPWPKQVKPPVGQTGLRTFIKVHVTPFDGPDASNGDEVYSNKNLTYKEIKVTGLSFNEGSTGNEELVPSVGIGANDATASKFFNLDAINIPDTSEDFTTILATASFNDGTPDETSVFAKNGATWEFDTVPSWLNLSQPTTVVSSLLVNTIERLNFEGEMVITDAFEKVELNVCVEDGSSNVITEDNAVVGVEAELIGISAAGIESETKVVVDTFTDFEILQPQLSTKIYGPISSNEYRTVALFPAISGSPVLPAYAVTAGSAILVEAGSTLNLILKPDAQPNVAFSPVKYFVYRGIKKDSFLTTGGDVIDANNAVNDLLVRMWEVNESWNTQQEALAMEQIPAQTWTDIPLVRGDLGLAPTGGPAIAPSTLIDELFDEFTFQPITQGWNIGEFDTSQEFGFQVLLDNPNYNHKYEDFAATDHKVTLSYASGQPAFPGSADDIEAKLQRESVLAYLDPAAYYGMQYDNKVNVRKTSGDISTDGDDLFGEVLTFFETRDRIYLDVRNELNDSLNFFGQYADSGSAQGMATFEFEDAGGATVTREYQTQGWPIVIFDNSDFPTLTGEKHKVKIHLPVGISGVPLEYNANPIVVLSGGAFYDEFPRGRSKYQLLTPGGDYTNEIELAVPNNANNSTVVAYALKLGFNKRYDITALPPPSWPSVVPIKDDYIDNVLTPLIPVSATAGSITWNTDSERRYLGWTSLQGADFQIRIGLAKDDIGETAFSFIQGPAEVAGETSRQLTHLSLDMEEGKAKGSFFLKYLEEERKALNLSVVELDLPTPVKLVFPESVITNYSVSMRVPSFDDVCSISYTAAERASIDTALSGFLTGTSIFFSAMNHIMLVDNTDRPYFEFDLMVQGIEYNNGTFTHQVNRVSTGLKLYSVDGKNYFTEAYANAINPIINPPI